MIDILKIIDKNAELTDKEGTWSGDTIVTCDGCYKDSICLKCRLHENLISRLQYKLFQQREITMGKLMVLEQCTKCSIKRRKQHVR